MFSHTGVQKYYMTGPLDGNIGGIVRPLMFPMDLIGQ